MKKSKGATATEIADDLTYRIESGEWARRGTEAERRFLTREQVREQYGSHLNTVEAAARILRTRGLIVARPRGGTFLRPPGAHEVFSPEADADTWTRSEPTGGASRALPWAKERMGHPAGAISQTRWILSRGERVHSIVEGIGSPMEVGVTVARAASEWVRVRTWLPSEEEAGILGMPQEIPVLGFLSHVPGGVVVRIRSGDRVEGRRA